MRTSRNESKRTYGKVVGVKFGFGTTPERWAGQLNADTKNN